MGCCQSRLRQEERTLVATEEAAEIREHHRVRRIVARWASWVREGSQHQDTSCSSSVLAQYRTVLGAGQRTGNPEQPLQRALGPIRLQAESAQEVSSYVGLGRPGAVNMSSTVESLISELVNAILACSGQAASSSSGSSSALVIL